MQKTSAMPRARALFRLMSLPQAAAAILALGASSGALAQNVANGLTLYNQKLQPGFGGALFNCADCHGDAPTARVIWSGRGITQAQLAGLIGSAGGEAMSAYRAQWGATQRNDVAAYVFSLPAPSPGAPPPPPPGVPPTPAITPASPVTFATTVVGSRSARVTLVMTNSSTTAPVTLGTPYVMNAGGAAGDFLLMPPAASATPTCVNGMVLAAQASCALGVEFMPSLTGGRTGNWNFSFMNSVPPRLVNFAGAGSTAPASPPPPPPPPPGSPPSAPAPAPAADGGGATGPAILAGLAAMLFAAGRRRRRDD